MIREDWPGKSIGENEKWEKFLKFYRISRKGNSEFCNGTHKNISKLRSG